jgi:hypothetical protein
MPFPGDNGDWTNFDQYMARLTSDIKANNMLPGLVIDIWNEPDGGGFWKRSQQQYLETWGRAFYYLRYVRTFQTRRAKEYEIKVDSLPATLLVTSLRLGPRTPEPLMPITTGGPAGWISSPKTVVSLTNGAGIWKEAVVTWRHPLRR